MRLTPDVALVAGGPLTGFGLSADFDSHVYLLDGGDELALIDCGLGTDAGQEALLANVAAAGADPARIRRLFVTHLHTDHAGGAGRYRERLGLRVAVGAGAASALEAAHPEATSFRSAAELGIFPDGYRYAPCQVDDPLEDGDERIVGRLRVRAIDTPGHSGGHTSFLVTGGERTCLFTGDAVFANGRILLQAIPDCDLAATLASIRRLHRETFDALLPGHGAIALSGGQAHVAAAVAVIDRLGVPASLV